MAFDVVMFGSVSLPELHLEDWLASPIHPADFPWLEDLGGTEVLHETPEAMFAALSAQTLAPHELLSVTLVEGQLGAQCYVSEDLYREHAQTLAALYASAAEFGGVGELIIAGYRGIRFGEKVNVRPGRSWFGALSEPELDAVERHPLFLTLDAKIHERFDALVGRAAEGPVDVKRSRWRINPFTGRRVRVAMEAPRDQ